MSTCPQLAAAQLKALETSLGKHKQKLSEGEKHEFKRNISYIVAEYGAMDERLETAIKKAL
jgi:hypothetical protein